jgi:FKBP-type peptidyl-prolyl cis-trans isomerase SlpA
MSDIIARASSPQIQAGAKVTLHFSLLFPTGEEIDSTRNGQPASFVLGDGSLLPGFEAVLLGKQAGFAEQILLPPEQAFGEHNPANVQNIKRDKFLAMVGDVPLEEGLVVSFQAPDGELPGVVVAVYEETVKVDFNHPLSGSPIIFDVAIVDVELNQETE